MIFSTAAFELAELPKPLLSVVEKPVVRWVYCKSSQSRGFSASLSSSFAIRASADPSDLMPAPQSLSMCFFNDRGVVYGIG